MVCVGQGARRNELRDNFVIWLTLLLGFGSCRIMLCALMEGMGVWKIPFCPHFTALHKLNSKDQSQFVINQIKLTLTGDFNLKHR